MSRLDEAGIHSIVWQEDESGVVFADCLQSYEIDVDNELAIFQGDKCVQIHRCDSVENAVAIAEASERVCRWNIKMGCAAGGYKINDRGWRL